MMNRSLRQRLSKLEGRFAPERKIPGVVIRLVDANREVTGTLYWEDGEWKTWYAPGHEPHECAEGGPSNELTISSAPVQIGIIGGA